MWAMAVFHLIHVVETLFYVTGANDDTHLHCRCVDNGFYLIGVDDDMFVSDRSEC